MVFQLLANALIDAGIYSLFALGLAVTYRVTRAIDFLQAALFTCAAYLTYDFSSALGCGAFPAATLSIMLVAILGISAARFVYQPLRAPRGSGLTLFLASLGAYVVLQNAILIKYGDQILALRAAPASAYDVFGATVTDAQVAILVTSVVLLTALWALTTRTRLGRWGRAIADNLELARIVGLPTDRILLAFYGVAAALAAVAGILSSLETNIHPSIGVNAIMVAIVVVIAGGGTSTSGMVLASVLLSFAQQLTAWTLGSYWQHPVAFAILLVILIFRPEGFFGKRIKKAGV